MARYDKYDPKVGGFRAALAADYDPDNLEKVFGVGLDSNGRVVLGAGNSGIVGLLVLTKARKAGEIVDVMTSGEIVEFGPTGGTPGTDFGTAGTVYYAHTANAAEQQTLTVTGTPTGGTFTLSFKGQTTTDLAYNASAATVVSALEALSTIGTGGVTGSGGALPGTPVVLTFAGALTNTDQPQITADVSDLTGGTNVAATVTTGVSGSGGKGEVASNVVSGAVRVGHTVEGQRLIVRVEQTAVDAAASWSSITGKPAVIAAGADRAAVLAILGTGTPSASNYLKGDGSWGTVT